MKKDDKLFNRVITLIILITAVLIVAGFYHDLKQKRSREKTMTIYTPVDIFYVTEHKLLFQTETGLDTVFNSKEALYRYIRLATQEDSTVPLSNCLP